MSGTGSNGRNSAFLVFGVIGPIAAVGMILLDVFISPWYSWSTNALSDLGVHPYSYLFDGGVIIEAIANLIFVVGLYRGGYAGTGTSALLAASGISLGFVGIFNETHHLLHLTFALVYFILFPIAIVLFSASRKLKGGYPRAVGYLAALIGLVFIIAGILEDFGIFTTPLGLGVYELVEALSLLIWSAFTAIYYIMRP